jgi:hypothetical protein
VHTWVGAGGFVAQHIPPKQSVAPATECVPVPQVELVGEPQLPPKLLQLAANDFGEKKDKRENRNKIANKKKKSFFIKNKTL